MEKILLEMKNITKTFPGVKALDDVNILVKENHIHGLVGENGAGKSTLMNVLSGVYPYGTYSGDILFDGKDCRFKTIKDSEKEGIVIIHQELALIPYLSIAENVFLGNECAKNKIIDWDLTNKMTEELLERVGLKENVSTLIKDIGVGKQQLVEIAKALAKKVRLLILDEPTAALNDEDSAKLLKLLLELKKQGLTSIIISHKLNEVTKIADEITVIRDGATIETLIKGVDEITEDRIIKGMVGRSMSQRYPDRNPNIRNEVFEIKNWVVHDPIEDDKVIIKNIDLNIRKGEIVGIAGLMGAGRTEFAMSVFGRAYGSRISGEIYKEGKKLNIKSIKDAINNGIAYVTEDRKTAGLVLMQDIKSNITLSNLEKVSKYNVVDDNKENYEGEIFAKKLNVKASSILQKAGELSGGNQQKVVLSKWLFSEPDILILDEPTRGIDVGAKYEIYTIINKLADAGKYVLLISSELPELLGLCDRIYVMNEGRIVGELDRALASQEIIMKHIIQSNREVV